MEDLEVIPPEEVKKVSVQLITYNGNQKSAYGSIFIDFKFDDGGKRNYSTSWSGLQKQYPLYQPQGPERGRMRPRFAYAINLPIDALVHSLTVPIDCVSDVRAFCYVQIKFF